MDSSQEILNHDQLQGTELIKKIVELTGLPEVFVEDELLALVQAQHPSPEKLTLSELRLILLTYLESLSEFPNNSTQ